MRLDGNAAAGALRDVFARDMTEAIAQCRGCGRRAPLAELLEYGHAMGIVLRCPACEAVIFRCVSTRRWMYVDGSGMAVLQIPQQAS
jgi:hypothetical protein